MVSHAGVVVLVQLPQVHKPQELCFTVSLSEVLKHN